MATLGHQLEPHVPRPLGHISDWTGEFPACSGPLGCQVIRTNEVDVVVVLAGTPVLLLKRCLTAGGSGQWAVSWPIFGIIPAQFQQAPSHMWTSGQRPQHSCYPSTRCYAGSHLNGPPCPREWDAFNFSILLQSSDLPRSQC